MAKKRYIQAVNDALFEEMERDPKVILFGEDVELAMMGDTRGLLRNSAATVSATRRYARRH